MSDKISDERLKAIDFDLEKIAMARELLALRNGGWISVKDRMPFGGDRVLVVEFGTVHAAYFQQARESWAGHLPARFVQMYGDDGSFPHVTHWQPLPLPPAQEKEAQ